MGDAKNKFQNRKKAFLNNPDISQEDKEWLPQYIDKLDDLGAKSYGTKANYIQAINAILSHHQFNITDLDNSTGLEQVNKEVKKAVKNSSYHRQKNSDYAKRRKRLFWTAWKRALKTRGIPTEPHREYIPQVKFTADKKKTETHPDDLPTSQQTRRFVQALEKHSSSKVAMRNQALILFIWDTGCRIGEILGGENNEPLKMKQVSVQGDRLHVRINGNKGADDRRIEVFQCREFLKKYIQQHPERREPEAVLFPKLKKEEYYEAPSKAPLRRKINTVNKREGFDFKTLKEPFHIFRKGMVTYYVMNDILDFEEVCKRQGKSPDADMPTYLKMAMQDIDSKAAQGFGLDNEERQVEHRMIGPGLLPRNCRNCGELQACTLETCSTCGEILPEADMPQNMDREMTEEALKTKRELEELKNQIDNELEQLK